MKKNIFSTNLPLWVLLTGGIGLLLRVWLMTSGVDQRGFITTGHIAAIALFVLVVGFLIALFFLTRGLIEATKYTFNFPASDLGGFGMYVAAAGIFVCSFIEIFTAADGLEAASALFGMVAALLLVLTGYHRRRGTAPSLLIHIGLCVFLMLRLICYYRHWSADPQILDYCFQLIATACLMLSTYQRAAFNADDGNRRSYAFFSLSSVFFSCLSLVGWSNIIFFLSVIVWQVTDICNLIPLDLDDVIPYWEDDEW